MNTLTMSADAPAVPLRQYRKLRHAIERMLYQKGLVHAPTRIMLTRQCLISMASLLAGLLGGWAHPWLLHFAIGAGLMTVNFYFMALFVQKLAAVGYSRAVLASMLARFYGRLLLTGVLLAVLLVWGQISLAALLAGLSTVVATIIIWGVEHYLAQHSKEA